MNVSIIGAGYVGLVTAACLAEKGHKVICVDVDHQKIERIRAAISPIHERGLDELLRRNVGTRLWATTDLSRAVEESDATLIAVGTPFEGHAIDLTYVRSAAKGVADALKRKATYHLVAVKSTVVPGTTDDVVRPILEETSSREAGRDFGVGVNPEFLTEGEAVDDFMHPDRLVLGGADPRTIETLAALYATFNDVPQIRTNNRVAEMIKYTSNALLATAISFSNEIANLCRALGGIDVADVMRGVHASHYLSPALPDGRRLAAPISAFLWPGCGFGGSCLPKDVRALIAHGRQAGHFMPLLDAVMQINDAQPKQIVSLLRRHFPSLVGVRVAILGLAFRPDTDDIRASPAIPIIGELLAAHARVKAYDPAVGQAATSIVRHPDFTVGTDLFEAVSDAQAIVLVTQWQEFRRLPELMARLQQPPVVIDGRRMLDKRSVARYEGIGLA